MYCSKCLYSCMHVCSPGSEGLRPWGVLLGVMPRTMQSNRKLICSPSEQDKKKTPAPGRWEGKETKVYDGLLGKKDDGIGESYRIIKLHNMTQKCLKCRVREKKWARPSNIQWGSKGCCKGKAALSSKGCIKHLSIQPPLSYQAHTDVGVCGNTKQAKKIK